MKKQSRYCPMCKKIETRDECSYGPKIWDLMSINESLIYEARRRTGTIRSKLADALLGVSFAATAAQSPQEFIRLGHIQAPSVALMQTWGHKRGEAERNLDSGRVSSSARNVKDSPNKKSRVKKSEPKISPTIGEELDKKTLIMMMIKKLINDKKRKNYLLNYGYIGEAKTPAWSRNEGKDLKKGGLNRKGIASYRRQHPGSKLSMAVTTEPSKLKKGSKKWKRRKSFCSRMLGMRRKLTSSKTARDPNSRINLSLKKWNC